jgi:ribosomal protein L11 methyltransferase
VPWTALTLEVAAAHAEALSDALLEQGAESVWIEPAGRLHALLAERADVPATLGLAARAAGLATPPFRTYAVADEDWVRATQAQFAPQCIAGKLWIVPSWHEAPPDGVVLRLDPGLAFGTGSHATTRLMLAWLASSALAGAHVLDYGCGSGILGIAAAKLGAAPVDAVDVDPDALAATRDNARANAVTVRAFPPEQLPPGAYDVVVANILAQPLILLEPLLAARTRPSGRIALAGILTAQAAEVVDAYAAHFEARVAAHEDGWSLVQGVRR